MADIYSSPARNRINVSNGDNGAPEHGYFYMLSFRSPLHASESNINAPGMHGLRYYTQAEVASTATDMEEALYQGTSDPVLKTWDSDSLSPADITEPFDTNYQTSISYVASGKSNTVMSTTVDVGTFYYEMTTLRLEATVASPYTSTTKLYFVAIEEYPFSENQTYQPAKNRGSFTYGLNIDSPLTAYELKTLLIESLNAYNLECRVCQTHLLSGRIYDIPPV